MWLSVALTLLLGGVTADIDWDTVTPIDEYIAFDDGMYAYEEIEQYHMTGVTIYVYNMTSQNWIGPNVTDQHIWYHWLSICIPDDLLYTEEAFLWIHGGRNRPDPPRPDDTWLTYMAAFSNVTGAITAIIMQTPNQPIVFKDDPEQKPRTEDDQIAYTWRMFREETDDPRILSRFPMTKGCVKAMDTVEFVAREKRPETNITRFMVAGGSKRGWAAWILAATDRRVVAAVPCVMSLLKYRPTLQHHWRSLGGWSSMFRDYYNQNLTLSLDHPRTEELFLHVDPWSYRKRLDLIPILVVSATGDEFFLADESRWWWDDFEGPIFMMMNENSHHSLFPKHLEIFENVVAFFRTVMDGGQFPTVSWTREATDTGGTITMTTSVTPKSVVAHSATSWSHRPGEQNRDFRWVEHLENNGTVERLILWFEVDVDDLGDNTFQATEVNDPDGEYRGMVMQARFDSGYDDFELTFTSDVNVFPDTYPYEACEGVDCYGTLR